MAVELFHEDLDLGVIVQLDNCQHICSNTRDDRKRSYIIKVDLAVLGIRECKFR